MKSCFQGVIAWETPRQPEVVDLIRALDAFQDTLYPPEARFALDIDALDAPHVLFAVARDRRGRAVGCAAMVLSESVGEGEVKRFYVEPSERRAGVASALLDALEAQAVRRGYRRFVLETGPRQPAALAFYARHGYRPCGPFGSYEAHPLSVFLCKTAGASP